MKIRKMSASFGALDGRTMELGEGLNIITAPNESGKSTWCAFLCIMLYGLNPSDRAKQGVRPERQRYAPWSGAPMAGTMELEHAGREITLRRWTEKAGAPMQAFSATYTGTDDPVPGLTGANVGETLTGVQRDVFIRSVFIRQGGISLKSNTNQQSKTERESETALEKRINAIVSSGEEGVSYSETDKRLHQWQRHRKSGSRGAIPETEQALSEAQESLRDQQALAARAAQLDDRIDELRAERAEAVRRMEDKRKIARKQALEDMSRSRQKLETVKAEHGEAARAAETAREALRGSVFGEMEPESAREKAEDIKRRAAGLEKLARRTPPLWISYIFLAVFVIAGVLALVLPWKAPLICVAAVALVLFALVFLRLNEMNKSARGMLEDRLKLLDSCGGADEAAVDAAVAAHETLWQTLREARAALEAQEQRLAAAREKQDAADKQFMAGVDFTQGDSEAAQAGRAVDELDRQIADLTNQRERLVGKASNGSDPVAIQSDILAMEGKLAALQEEYDALQLAIETLAEADSELRNRFSPALSRRTGEHFRCLTGGRYDAIELARDLTARAQPHGDSVSRAMDSLSAGTVDQLYLALRMAVCELALPEDEPCPMILDDALVSFDDKRLALALQRIREIAETRQVLLFSCHEREARYFENDPTAAMVSVGI